MIWMMWFGYPFISVGLDRLGN